jgi:hypothetical protein
MAETLGTITSILQLVAAALKAREYVKDFHDAPREQQKLFSEMEDLKTLLTELRKRAESNLSTDTFPQMAGPLDSLKTTMESFTAKLGPADGISKFTKRLTWSLWSKKEALGYLEELERIKSLINVWLTTDIWYGYKFHYSPYLYCAASLGIWARSSCTVRTVSQYELNIPSELIQL